MTYWTYLFPLAALNLLGAFLTYSKYIQAPWAPWVMGLLSAGTGVGWALAAKKVPTQPDMVVFSFCYDLVMTLSYLAVPFLFFNLRVSWVTALGITLAVIGILVTKADNS